MEYHDLKTPSKAKDYILSKISLLQGETFNPDTSFFRTYEEMEAKKDRWSDTIFCTLSVVSGPISNRGQFVRDGKRFTLAILKNIESHDFTSMEEAVDESHGIAYALMALIEQDADFPNLSGVWNFDYNEATITPAQGEKFTNMVGVIHTFIITTPSVLS